MGLIAHGIEEESAEKRQRRRWDSVYEGEGRIHVPTKFTKSKC